MKVMLALLIGIGIGVSMTADTVVINQIKYDGTLWCYPADSHNDLSRKLFYTKNGKTEVLIPCTEKTP